MNFDKNIFIGIIIIISIFLLILSLSLIKKQRLPFPYLVFVFIFFVYFVFGLIHINYSEVITNQYKNPIIIISIYGITSLIILIIAPFIVQKKSIKECPIYKNHKNKILFLLLIFFTLCLSIFGFLIYSEFFKYIPILEGKNSQVIRYTLQNSYGSFKGLGFGLQFGFLISFVLSFYYVKLFKSLRYLPWAIFFIGIPFFIAYTGRLFILYPLLFIILNIDYKSRFNNKIYVLLITFFIYFTFQGISSYRYEGRIKIAELINLNSFCFELEHFAMFLHNTDVTKIPRLNLFQSIFLYQFAPYHLLKLLGLDKKIFYQPIGKFVQSSIPQFSGFVNLGIRTTIFGESIIVGDIYFLLLILVLIAIIFLRYQFSHLDLPSFISFRFLLPFLILSIPYGLQLFSTSLVLTFILYLSLNIILSKNG